ncbi:carboxymuconolactone decarboxylase family protein [Streptomyces diastatochromogenes]|nr:carboxymuconolactone decarboxylase family protein [Streptomyces diastatochromogenes]
MLRDSLRQIRHIAAVPHTEARGQVAEVYARARREFGVVAPPLALHSPAPEALAASWLLLRETLLAQGRVSRAAKEAVATAISRANDCPYCVEVHEAKLATLTGAGAHGALADWADRNALGPAEGEERRPFDAADAPEILGTAVTFHYLNRMVRLFLPDSPVPDAAPAKGRGPVMRMVARAMRPDTGTTVTPARRSICSRGAAAGRTRLGGAQPGRRRSPRPSGRLRRRGRRALGPRTRPRPPAHRTRRPRRHRPRPHPGLARRGDRRPRPAPRARRPARAPRGPQPPPDHRRGPRRVPRAPPRRPGARGARLLGGAHRRRTHRSPLHRAGPAPDIRRRLTDGTPPHTPDASPSRRQRS